MALIELKDVCAGYGKNVILKDFCIDIAEGKLVSLLGPSGCGKTTTLRTMAGFIDVLSGRFLFNGQDFSHVPIHKRGFGYVFQSYALFPHLNVFDNVAFGLRQQKVPKAEIAQRVSAMLERVNLSGYEKRLPAEMSGGQRQRVALARSLVLKPKLLLLDEPLSNLDAKLRVQMRVEIRRLQQEMGITTVYVTHDQEECFSISDQVAIMNGGKIEQMDVPENIYTRPVNEFTARFVGFENFSPLPRQGDHYVSASGATFRQPVTQDRMQCACRPEDIVLEGADAQGDYRLPGEVLVCTFLGKQLQYLVKTQEGEYLVNTDVNQRLQLHERVTLFVSPDKSILVSA